jgi:hypothetical protein
MTALHAPTHWIYGGCCGHDARVASADSVEFDPEPT